MQELGKSLSEDDTASQKDETSPENQDTNAEKPSDDKGLCGLESSPYHITTSSPLMVLANEAARPFPGDKERLHAVFPTPGGLFDSFPSLPPPPLGFGGAFRPLSASDNGFHHGSAFAPAAKCLKTEVTSYEASSSFLSPSGSSGSPLAIKEEDADHERQSETPASDGADSTERMTPDEGRQLRKVKKRINCEESCCPVCGVTVRRSDLYLHFRQEVDKLSKIPRSVQRPLREGTPSNKSSPSPSGSRRRDSVGEKTSPESRWEMYERVKASRQNRLNARANRGKRKKPSEEQTCPVCRERMSGSLEEMNEHVVLCLRRREGNCSEDETVDVEGDETFEEYEWAGQTRIRTTSLLSGGYSGLGFQSNKKNTDEDDDQDLNVDGDDSVAYGNAQYSEADIILCSSDDDKERNRLRQAVIMNGEAPTMRYQEKSYWGSDSGIKQEQDDQDACTTTTADSSEQRVADSERVLTSLKERILELEEIQKGEKLRCLVCMESYNKPVVSVCCWHVHCEECWLRTLGAKKLCPQCSAITSPTDLRRIYL